MYFLALFATLFIVLLQFIMHRYPIGNDKYTGARLEIVLNDDPASVEKVSGLMKKWGMLMEDSTVERNGGQLKYTLDVKLPSREVQEEINNYIISYPEICSIKLKEMI